MVVRVKFVLLHREAKKNLWSINIGLTRAYEKKIALLRIIKVCWENVSKRSLEAQRDVKRTLKANKRIAPVPNAPTWDFLKTPSLSLSAGNLATLREEICPTQRFFLRRQTAEEVQSQQKRGRKSFLQCQSNEMNCRRNFREGKTEAMNFMLMLVEH